jgi:hypothetical protein
MAKRINEVDPDGLRVAVPWESMDVGDSVFVPCINTESCKRQADEIAKRLGLSLTHRQRIEHQLLGLRIWRTA